MIGRSKLAERISEELETDPRTADAAISVVDDDGLVTLAGAVGDQEIRMAAEQVARSFDEVTEVVNDLEVEGEVGVEEGDEDEKTDVEPVLVGEVGEDEEEGEDEGATVLGISPETPSRPV